MSSMIAARVENVSAELRLTEVDVPEVGPRDVLVEVASAGIAPGMMSLLRRGAFSCLPTTLGHEAAGRIVVRGNEVNDLEIGLRVRVHPNLTCGRCPPCSSGNEMMCEQFAIVGHASFGRGVKPLYEAYHDGALARYVRVPARLVDPLPEAVSFDVGAKIHDLANAMRALRSAQLEPSSTLVITAATGTMGTSSTLLAPHLGVTRLVLVARRRERLEAVRQLAGSLPTDIVALEELPDGWEGEEGLTQALRELIPEGADAVLDYVPEGPAGYQALGALTVGGRFVHMGANADTLPCSALALALNCWQVIGTRGNTRVDVHHVLNLLASRTLDAEQLITHHFALQDIDEAFAAVEKRDQSIWMAVIHPSGSEVPSGSRVA